MMRFAVEQINNSTKLLPNVSLGYQIFDHCSDTRNFPGIFDLISFNGSVQSRDESQKTLTKVTAVVGSYTSTETLSVAPLLMMDLIPMVSYGAATSIFSSIHNFPSFFRTVHPNKDVVEVIFNILLHFDWRWVAFLNIDNDYGKDGQEQFRRKIEDSQICLAYSKGLNYYTNYTQVFKQIEAQRVNILIVFAPEWTAAKLIESAIQLNVTNKVWIAGDAWSLNKKLPKEKGIRNVGTVLGVAEPAQAIPGFSDFILSFKSHTHCGNEGQQTFCNQVCNCSSLSAEDIITADPSFSFPVYSAVYSIAYALHNVLKCGAGTCNDSTTVYPHMVLAELKKSNFTLLNQSIQFDKNGDPKFGSYSIIYWNQSGEAQEIGFYSFPPSFQFVINSTKIQWYKNREVPTSVCSPECPVGYAKKPDGIHECCFTCQICLNGTYVNSTEDPYKCMDCKETEWSAEGSTSCTLRLVEYIPFTDSGAILIMFGASALVGISLTMSGLFAVNYNTPVCTVPASEFQLEGDYLIGGLFDIHHVIDSVHQVRPEAINCSSQPFIVSSYRRFQMMRFAVEQINNSTNLLPNVSLGYEIFDHCSDVSYGAASSAFSEKAKYPSFLRTVHSNEEIIEVIVSILLHFKWKWVAFLYSGDDFGVDGLTLFIKRIKDTEICLPFTKTLIDDTNHSQMFRQIDVQRIDIIVVYASKLIAEDLIRSAIRLNVTNKVWIAGDTWSLNKMLPKERGIQNIGTVLGVS
ncbi:unnamed protein product, partial [Pleuronectes platessa]